MKVPAVLTLMALLLCGCHDAAEKEQKQLLAATAPQLAWAAKAVAGPQWRTVTLLPPGADPETYEPTLATMRDLAGSQLLFTFDTPGFEQALTRAVESGFPGVTLVDAGQGIPRLSDTHHHDHDHGSGHNHDHATDPHLATSPINMERVVRNIERALRKADPANAAVYTRRADSVARLLNALDLRLRERLDSLSDRSFVVVHPSLSYFAARYGLHQIPMGRKGTEESPAMYAARTDEARASTVLIVESTGDPARARATARTLGLPLVTVSLNSEDWQEALLEIADAIRNASDTKAE